LGSRKPDARLLAWHERTQDRNLRSVFYIGDNPQKDLLGAKKAGMDSSFRSEFKPYNDLQPDRTFNDYSELLKILRECKHQQDCLEQRVR